MLVFDTTVLVGRTPQIVFDFVARDFFANLPKFNPDVREMKKLTEGPVGVGTRGLEVQEIRGTRYARTFEVTEYEPGKAFAYRSLNNDKVKEHAVVRYLFSTDPQGTRVVQRFELDWDKPLFRIAPWFVRLFIKKAVKRSVQELLKKAAEEA